MFEEEPKIVLSKEAWVQMLKELEDNLKNKHGWEKEE